MEDRCPAMRLEFNFECVSHSRAEAEDLLLLLDGFDSERVLSWTFASLHSVSTRLISVRSAVRCFPVQKTNLGWHTFQRR